MRPFLSQAQDKLAQDDDAPPSIGAHGLINDHVYLQQWLTFTLP